MVEINAENTEALDAEVSEVAAEETAEAVKNYELRELKSTDLGPICRIITAIGIKAFRSCFESEEVKELQKQAAAGKKVDINDIGIGVLIDIASVIISNIPKAEKEIMAFVGSVAGMKYEEVKNVSFAEYGEMILSICMKDDFKDFFGRAIKLFK